MARPLRLQFPNACYHVIARGNARQRIFLDDDDCQRFLIDLRRVVDRLGWSVAAYCLMPNHYHLLIQTPTPNLVRGMRDLNGAYSQGFNKRHARVGHLFQGRYKAQLVEEVGYLMELARYIVLNPVRAGLCDRPEGWTWSSYGVTVGLSPSSVKVSDLMLVEQFGSAPVDAVRAYIRFVQAGIGAPGPASRATTAAVVGSASFGRRLAMDCGVRRTEVPRAERAFLSIEDHVRASATRNEAMWRSHASGHYSLAQIGRHFGVTYSTVSRVVRNYGK